MSKKLMIVYGLLVMFLFYSLFITYVILAEPPRLSLEDALIWGWIWALAFGYCTYGTLKLYRQFREGNLKRITYSPAIKRLITICQVAGSIVWAYVLLCLINTTDTALSPWHIWVPLAVGFVLVGIVMGAMYRDRKRQRGNEVGGAGEAGKGKTLWDVDKAMLSPLFTSLVFMTVAFAILSCFESSFGTVDVFGVWVLALITVCCYLFGQYARKHGIWYL
jgi:hypothetical protein